MKVWTVGHGWDRGYGDSHDDLVGVFLSEESADSKADSLMRVGEWKFTGVTNFDLEVYPEYPVRVWGWERDDSFVYMQEWEVQ